MLHDNLKALRKQKGISQEELAAKIHVVRQTVSKWEKGLSVPDAEMLVKIADLFEVPVSRLLGGAPAAEEAAPADRQAEIAEQLMKINEQLVIKNNRGRKIFRFLLIVLVGIPLAILVLSLIAAVILMVMRTSGPVKEYGTDPAAFLML